MGTSSQAVLVDTFNARADSLERAARRATSRADSLELNGVRGWRLDRAYEIMELAIQALVEHGSLRAAGD